MLLEAVGDVLEEDQAENDMLVLRRIHVVAELVGHQPELRLEADRGGGIPGGRFRLRRLRNSRHAESPSGQAAPSP